MLFKRTWILGCLLIISCCFGFSQEVSDSITLNLENLNIKDGLSQGMVRSIIQDKEGFMWFATKDGLNKYNGYQITVYRNDLKNPFSLPDNYVTSLAEDDYGNFWVGTSTKGILLFDKVSERFYPINIVPQLNSLQDKEIKFLECKGRTMLLATANNIYIFDIGRFNPAEVLQIPSSIHLIFNYNKSHPKHPYEDPSKLSQNITWMPNREVWISRKDGIAICKPSQASGTWTLTEHAISEFGIPPTNYTSIYVCKIHGQPKYFVQLRESILIYNDSLHQTEHVIKTEFNKSYILPKSDSNGNVLFELSTVQYLFHSKTNKVIKIIPNDKKIHLSYLGFCIDRRGIIWLGTNGFGVTKYDPKKQFFRSENLLKKRLSNSLASNPLLIKSWRPIQLDLTKNSYIDLLPGLFPEHKFTHILEDSKGLIWMKSSLEDTVHRYLISYDQKTKAIKKYNGLNLYPRQFESFYTDNENQLWVIFYNAKKMQCALRLFNPLTDSFSTEYVFKVRNSSFDQYATISQCWRDNKGIFWLASLEGLVRVDIDKKQHTIWQHDPYDSSSLSNNSIFSLCPDPKQPDNYLWLGTNGGGLNKFEYATGKFYRYTETDGLPNNVVYGILSDNLGRLWLSTNFGLSCLSENSSRSAKGVFFRNFTVNDGLSDNEFNRYEYAKLNSGELVFGGVDGITRFNPSEVITNITAPAIKICGLTVFNQPVNNITNSDILDKPIPYTSYITLRHDQNMFTLEFAGLDYSSANKKQYKYVLDGFNETWIDNGSKNFTSFTNLDPGTYNFKVTVSINGGPWNSTPASIRINILPPWWQTWWFRLLLVSLVIGIGYTIFYYRYLQNLKFLKLRNRIADDLHDDIGSTLSSISLSSAIIQHKLKNESAEVKKLLTQISSNTDNMMESMSDIVWTINARNDSFEDTLLRMKAFAIQLLEPKNYIIHFEVADELSKLKLNIEQRKNLYLIYKEAIHNVAKYAQAKQVWVTLAVVEKRKLVMKIKDDGIGMEATLGNALGGNGLTSMKKRAGELQGELEINSSLRNGTEIVLKFTM